MSLNNVKVVKKDGTKEEFNVQKVVVAVNKSAYRALIKFSQKDIVSRASRPFAAVTTVN